ncbi:RHS repeat-associated core domain-containing protein [Granulicella sp. dw_53]|uniref:RHS repeat-associated core domain-containing protein n=1 Tax=Granulicella sp. dw_53 TaxID=2719792 RepID=UPI001BD6046F|nr:RHS repeat-associated core domain-containing protein [Granulicella sp. dw_53]
MSDTRRLNVSPSDLDSGFRSTEGDMNMRFVSRHKVKALVLVILFGLLGKAYASSTGSLTIEGTEQHLDAINAWDSGTITVSVNYHTEIVAFGEFSTPDSIASGIAAKFSCDCGGPVNAKSAPGGVIYFKMRGGAQLTQLSVTLSSTASFHWTSGTSMQPTTTSAKIGSSYLFAGQSTAVDVQVSCNSACGVVDYRLDGGAWGQMALDQSGHFQAITGNWAPGLHNVVVNFLGNGVYAPSSSNPVSFTISSSSMGSTAPPLYSYAISAYQGNGNIAAYSDSINGQWSGIAYDGVNRLNTATYIPNGSATQYMCWGYDSFGNRTTQGASNLPFLNTACQPDFSSSYTNNWANYDSNNHATGTAQSPSYPVDAYDQGGNLQNDGIHQFLYDAEGRLCASSGPLGMSSYIYDGEGGRVVKGTISVWNCNSDINGFSETAGYVLGPGGEQVTEVDGAGNWVHTNVFAAGHLVATYDQQGVHFHLNDWLGSRRVQTDYAGNTEATYQSLPFGEMLPNNQAASLGATEQHFTGKERDSESGNDYFGARYYASSMGRFVSPDPSVLDFADLGNPQSLNLYSYALNNPLKYIDPTGLDQCIWDDGTRDDEVQYGGASQQDCKDQGGNWAGNTDASIKVTASSSGNTITTYDMGYMGGQIAFAPGTGCSAALSTAKTNAGAMNRYYNQYQSPINSAANANGIDPVLLGAVGVHESGMQNIAQYGGGKGAGVFQIDLGANPGVQSAQAYNVNFAANFSAGMLSSNMTFLASAHPNFSSNQLAQATAATYNMGLGTHPKGKNVSGNPNTIDKGTTGGNYGSNVVALMNNCFHN